jgi:hypothetical protein
MRRQAVTNSPRSSPKRAIRLLAGLLLPLLAFVVMVQSLGNATEALAITDAVPLLWVIAYGAWRRRIEPIGLTATGVFAVALLLTIASGGSSLPLELHRAVFPGLAGTACLISLAARRPLLSKLAQARTGATVETRPDLDSPGARRSLTTLTAVIGITLFADAAAQVILAFAVSTSTFGVVARVASYLIIATGLAACALYVRRVRARLQDRAESQPPPPNASRSRTNHPYPRKDEGRSHPAGDARPRKSPNAGTSSPWHARLPVLFRCAIGRCARGARGESGACGLHVRRNPWGEGPEYPPLHALDTWRGSGTT